MTLYRKQILTTLMALGCGALTACSSSGTSKTFPSEAFTPFPQNTVQVENISAPDIEITGYLTGWVKAPAKILIDQNSEGLPDHLRAAQWVPSVAYLVTHPEHGSVILDTGLRAGACDYGLRPVYWVPCRNTKGSDLVSQLKQSGINSNTIKYIIPSHFHGDHISGLSDVLAYTDAPVLLSKNELQALRSPFRAFAGTPTQMVKDGFDAKVIDANWQENETYGKTFDVFGDGSLRLISTSGHTHGHLSALVSTQKAQLLLTFDAAHLQANLDLMQPSGAVSSKPGAVASLEMIKTASLKNPNLTLIFGHEPSQWNCVTGPVDVLKGVPVC